VLGLIMVIALLFSFAVCFGLYVSNDETSQFMRNLKILIRLLRNMGYYPKQISNILDFYD